MKCDDARDLTVGREMSERWSDSISFHDGAGDGSCEFQTESQLHDIIGLLDQVWPRDDGDPHHVSRRFGRFTIVRELGRGGFGVVYLAEDPLLKRTVALKLPLVEFLAGTESWRRFLREAQAASRLDHPNVIPLLDAGAVGPLGYIVSAYVSGPSLEHWLRRHPRGISQRWAASVVSALARAIEHAHGRGILHRDLKPANVMLSTGDHGRSATDPDSWQSSDPETWIPRICDFGMAKLHEVDGDDTRSRTVCGSPPYMAPEQAEARKCDIGPATDVYGLGAILYQSLCGRPPFSGNSSLEILRNVVAVEPVSPRKLGRGVSRDLETICLKCLLKRPESRYSSARELADDLDAYLAGRPIKARRPAFWIRTAKWARRHPAAAALMTAVLAATAAAVGGLLWHDAVLRNANNHIVRINERLTRVNCDLERALDEKAQSTMQLRLQLADAKISRAHRAFSDDNCDLAGRLLDEAAADAGLSGKAMFASDYVRSLVDRRLKVFRGEHFAPVISLAQSPDGRTIASGDLTAAIRLWDIETGRCVKRLNGPDGCAFDLVFSVDGKSLAASNMFPSQLRVFDLASGIARRVVEVNPSCNRIGAYWFEPYENKLKTIWTRDFSQSPRPAVTHAGSKDEEMFGWVHDGPPLSPPIANDRVDFIVDVLDGKILQKPSTTPDFQVRSASPHAAVTRDLLLTVFDDGHGAFTVHRTGSRTWLAKVQQAPTGIVVIISEPAATANATANAGERERIEHLARVLVPEPRGGDPSRGSIVTVTAGAFAELAPHGRTIAYWREPDKRIEVVDLGSGRTIATHQVGATNNASSMLFLKDGRSIATGFRDQTVRVWNSERPRGSLVMSGHAPTEAWALAFAPDGRTLASGGDDHTIRLWDCTTGRLRATLNGHESLVTALAFSADGKSLFSGSFERGKELLAWDVAAGRPKQVFSGHGGRVRAISLSSDDRVLISGCDDSKLRLWDVTSGRLLRTVVETGNRVIGVAVSPDGGTVATVREDSRVVMTDVATGSSRSIPATDPPTAVTFSADGSRLYFAERTGQIAIWDVVHNKSLRRFAGHDSYILSLAVSPDGATLASASDDKTVRLWDTTTHNELLHFTDFKARVNKVVFSRDGTMLAAADHDGLVTLWSTRSTAGETPSQIGEMRRVPIAASDRWR